MSYYNHHSLVYARVYQRVCNYRNYWRGLLGVALVYAAVTIPMIIARDNRTLWTFFVPILISLAFAALSYAYYRRMVRAQQQLDNLTESSGIGRLWDDL